MMIISWTGFVDWLQGHLLTCPSVYLFGVTCPGCGMQRSFIALLSGDIARSWHYHPATVPLLFLIVLLAAHLRFRFRWGAKILVGLQLLVAVLSISFYVYKIIS